MQNDLEKITPLPLVNSTCTECGAVVPAEFESCDAFLGFILSNYLKPAEPPPRLLIDTFAIQHPKRACKSAKSYAAHLTGLCCGMEYNGAKSVFAALQRWLNGPVERIGLKRPQEPEHSGRLTIRHLYGVDDRAEFDQRLRECAMDVWDAYTSQHKLARRWIETALKWR